MSRLDLALEQRVLRELKRLKTRPRRVLLAVSGGVDSIVMAEILWKWRRGLGFELAVAHVHHGRAGWRPQAEYRRRAREFVRAWANAKDLPFFTNGPKPGPQLKSEAELRAWRERHLHRWRTKGGFDCIAFAHHEDDLLETRVIRLIRGSGAQGLRSMCLLTREKFRPLLGLSSAEIRSYAREKGLAWVEDPSNARTEAFRNWLRADWLPALESKRPGALKALSRSLETLSPRASRAAAASPVDLAPHVGLRRSSISSLARPTRRSVVARYLNGLGLKGYGQSHVDEILKRIDTKRKNFTFEMLGLKFSVTPDFLWASRV